jgi:glutathione synthase/RimK-type ligase-like ATP-grasp enzyme
LRPTSDEEAEIRIGIVSIYEPGERWSYPLGSALERIGADWVPLEGRHLKAVVNDDRTTSLLIDGDPDIEEMSVEELALDGIVWRVSEGDYCHYANVFGWLSQRYPTVNNWRCTWTCSDKWRTSTKLAASGITVVPTVLLTPHLEIPAFPNHKTVIKPSVGAGGHGVRLATPGTMPGITVPHVAQPLVTGPSSAHIRVVVCGLQPVASIHRIPAAKHIGNEIDINNVAAGGTPVPAPMEPVQELAVQVARCLGGDILGIDLVPWNGGFAVLEVNSSPGFNGIAETLGIDCFDFAAKHALSRIHSINTNFVANVRPSIGP